MWQDLIRETLSIYRAIDARILGYKAATGIRCPEGCGICCESRKVEATILECLPLAMEIIDRGKETATLDVLEYKQNQKDQRCVHYARDTRVPDMGRCTFYMHRPLVCRLFGFAARRNRFGGQEICLCAVTKSENLDKIGQHKGVLNPENAPPIYQDCFMRIASLDPTLGFRLLSINTALKQAVEYLQWRHTSRCHCRKAA